MKKVLAFFMTAVMVCSMGTTAFGAVAKPSSDKVSVNGKLVSPQVYNIDGYNYFKLRDVAKSFAGSMGEFNVGWDAAAQKIKVERWTPYNGSVVIEPSADRSVKTAIPNNDFVNVDGSTYVYQKAYTIDGYNYFKLRDLTQVHDFWIFWDAETKTIGVDSDNPVGYGGPADEEEKVISIDEFAKDFNKETEKLMIRVEPYTNYKIKNWDFQKEIVIEYVGNPYEHGYVHFNNCAFRDNLTTIGFEDEFTLLTGSSMFASGKGIVYK